MKVCIIGGGGNVSEGVGAFLATQGHSVYYFRFKNPIHVAGVPRRPERARERLRSVLVAPIAELGSPSVSLQYRWCSEREIEGADVVLFAMPSYMSEVVGARLGKHLRNKVFLNLSDRFLGTYALLHTIDANYGVEALPRLAIAFNGVPIMAQKQGREGATVAFHVKPSHTFSAYPAACRAECEQILTTLFELKVTQLRMLPTFLHLAFENAHCIEHAVADLANLKLEKYRHDTRLYDRCRYTASITNRIGKLVAERDAISMRCLGRRFLSLADYDRLVFPSRDGSLLAVAGLPEYRIYHERLRCAPSPESYNAFGFEDVGWSMVTMESVARHMGMATPHLTLLIDEWCMYVQVDYRSAGRTLKSLGLGNTRCGEVPTINGLMWRPVIV
jgi:hypothetical protein